MSNETHYLDIRLGIDFKKILSPENINGVKFMLGVQEDEEVIQSFSNEIVDDVIMSLQKRMDYTSFAGANINVIGVEEDEGLQPNEVVDELVPDELVPGEPFEEISDEDDILEEDLEIKTPEKGALLKYDDYFNSLYEELKGDLFKTQSFMGTDVAVYLRRFDEYALTLVNETEVPVLDIIELGLDEDLSDVDYILKYKDFNGTEKYGRKKIKKHDSEGVK